MEEQCKDTKLKGHINLLPCPIQFTQPGIVWCGQEVRPSHLGACLQFLESLKHINLYLSSIDLYGIRRITVSHGQPHFPLCPFRKLPLLGSAFHVCIPITDIRYIQSSYFSESSCPGFFKKNKPKCECCLNKLQCLPENAEFRAQANADWLLYCLLESLMFSEA